MKTILKDILEVVKRLPEDFLNTALDNLMELESIADAASKSVAVFCLSCGSDYVVKNGKRRRKQAYLCRDCGKTFVETSGSIIAYSHSSKAVWRRVVADTVNGVSIDDTAEALNLGHSTVFNMRHKILRRIEDALLESPVELNGACEADETFVLESVKGRKIPKGYHRKARRHGAKAVKRGISSEYVCVCTGITNDGDAVAVSVNRATPSSAEILEVFENRVNKDTVVLCDGNRSYNVLESICSVAVPRRINKVNGFHSYIKRRLRHMAGVATIYQNRYNSLFATAYARGEEVIEEIFNLITARDGSYASIADNRLINLLLI